MSAEVAKSQGYRFACEWIALNDNTASETVESDWLTVALVADVFAVSCEKVAKDATRIRERFRN